MVAGSFVLLRMQVDDEEGRWMFTVRLLPSGYHALSPPRYVEIDSELLFIDGVVIVELFRMLIEIAACFRASNCDHADTRFQRLIF